jgi:hypothetical protein
MSCVPRSQTPASSQDPACYGLGMQPSAIRTASAAQSCDPPTRCLRFAARVASAPRKTRFRLCSPRNWGTETGAAVGGVRFKTWAAAVPGLEVRPWTASAARRPAAARRRAVVPCSQLRDARQRRVEHQPPAAQEHHRLEGLEAGATHPQAFHPQQPAPAASPPRPAPPSASPTTLSVPPLPVPGRRVVQGGCQRGPREEKGSAPHVGRLSSRTTIRRGKPTGATEEPKKLCRARISCSQGSRPAKLCARQVDKPCRAPSSGPAPSPAALHVPGQAHAPHGPLHPTAWNRVRLFHPSCTRPAGPLLSLPASRSQITQTAGEPRNRGKPSDELTGQG